MTKTIKQVGVQKNTSLGFFDRFARSLVFKMFDQLEVGHLILEENDQSYYFGQDETATDLVAHICINNSSTYSQMLLNGSIGAAEAYMLNAWQSKDLVALIQLFSANQKALVAMDTGWSKFAGFLSGCWHRMNANSLSGAKKNISAHYDLSNEFFALLLDPSMMYSAAIYPYKGASLHEASINKLDHICKRLDLQKDDHLLEIGTGWGSMAIHAARNYACRVTTTTISKQQYDYAVAAVKHAGLEDRIEVLFKDYRELQGRYDKLVSVEMIEAVGHDYYAEYFHQCGQLLKPDGQMLIQSITIADQRYQQYRKSVDFIQRYIFPGGALPSIEVISRHIAADTDMQIIGLQDISFHYADTLADWRKHFFDKIEDVRSLGFDQVFERMWEFYLCYCEGGFRERVISAVQVLAAKPQSKNLPEVV